MYWDYANCPLFFFFLKDNHTVFCKFLIRGLLENDNISKSELIVFKLFNGAMMS